MMAAGQTHTHHQVTAVDPRIERLVALREQGVLTPAEAKALRRAAAEKPGSRQRKALDALVTALVARGVAV